MAKFISYCDNHVLCIKPDRQVVVDGIPVLQPGEHIRFNNGVYETNDKTETEFIRKHWLFGSKITEVTEEKAKSAAATE
ncbi:hypothetical protein [Paenibacillus kobensis]|uniref:hypothetical protein n=1 Tax=Paenibacillus kobensis TaxID=59841 RepID=UPI000FDBBCC4|nr:hypothetical protein [Paenibacillus kobensis]